MIEDYAAKFIWDAREAAKSILKFVVGQTFEDYLANDMLRFAIERQFTTIGDAFAQLRRHDPYLADTIPDLPRVVAFRNLLVHGYADIDNALVWRVISRGLSPLMNVLNSLLDRAEPL